MSLVEKLCSCASEKWPKCTHPWYLKKFRWKGTAYKPNLTRYSREVMQPPCDLPTKTEAETVAGLVRSAIRAGTYISAKTQRVIAPPPVRGQSVVRLVAIFDREVITPDVHKRATTKAGDRGNLARFVAFIGDDRSLAEVTIADLLAFRTSPVLQRAANSTWAKYRTNLGQLFAWAVGEGYLTTNPFVTARPDQRKQLRRGKTARRSRRVDEREEAALLRAAGVARDEYTARRLQSLIIGAIETGMRCGELLALQWGDVDLEQRLLYVRAVETGAAKTGEPRPIPISERLLDELATLTIDPAGERFGRAAYVFGDAIGGRVKAITKAWETAVLRAHGHEPTWVKTSLSRASRAALDTIDLHFHDLRHEAGSRWLESKAFDLEQIRSMYGHATVAQTAAYLHGRSQATRGAMQQYDAQRRRLAREAEAQAETASARLDSVSSVPKLSQNAKPGRQSSTGPRLVTGANRRGIK